MRQLGLLVLVGLALTAGAVGAQTKPPTKVVYTLTTKDVSVGLSAQTSIPLTLGYWKAEGLDVEVTTLEGSTAGLQQLAAGNINFATVGPEVALIARERGVKVKSFYVVSGVTIFRVVVPRDSPIQTVADLRVQPTALRTALQLHLAFTRDDLRRGAHLRLAGRERPGDRDRRGRVGRCAAAGNGESGADHRPI